ncbi:hypothetical protein TNCV_4971, partial [Trichonephila clavipes]
MQACMQSSELLTASFHDFGDNFKLQRNSYPGFSSGRPRGTTPADDRYIVLQARRNRRQTAGEIARHTTQATGRPISALYRGQKTRTVVVCLHDAPVRCVPLTPAHRNESRFSLSSDSHRILIWREREAAIIPRTSLKGT